LLLVTTNELPALQAAQRALSYLDTNRIGRWKIRLVVNRYLRDVGLSREVIGTALTPKYSTLCPVITRRFKGRCWMAKRFQPAPLSAKESPKWWNALVARLNRAIRKVHRFPACWGCFRRLL